jgi:hypothetical protein
MTMKRTKYMLALAAVFALAGLVPGAQAQEPFRVNDDQVKQALVRLENGADTFRKSLDEALDKSRFDGTNREDNINEFVKEFAMATDRLRKNFDDDRPAADDASEVLRRAERVERFMRRHTLTPRAQSDWTYVRETLDQLALAYNVTWSWTGEVQTERVSDRDVRGLLDRVEKGADSFRRSLKDALDDSRFDDRAAEDEINQFVRDFEVATDQWKNRFDDKNAAVGSATEVLERAARIDAFMRRYPLSDRAQSDWATLRVTLDDLARAYNVTWTWEV